MKILCAAAIGLVVSLDGCRATRDVVATSYHVATAPVRLVHRAIAGDDTPPQPTVASDVEIPGRPVSPTYSPPPSRRRTADTRASAGRSSETTKTRSSTQSSRSVSAPQQFPTAKPVPGRSGLVYNPYDPDGAYIDVTGYAPGSKVKDPDTQKIFIVP